MFMGEEQAGGTGRREPTVYRPLPRSRWSTMTSTYAVRGAVAGHHRPLCVRALRVRTPRIPRTGTHSGVGAVMPTIHGYFVTLTCADGDRSFGLLTSRVCGEGAHVGGCPLPLSPGAGRVSVVAAEGRRERERGTVPGGVGDLGQAEIAGAQVVAGEGHPPFGQVLHGGLAERLAEGPCEGGSGQAADRGEFGNGPRAGRVLVHGLKRRAQPRVRGRSVPARRGRTVA